MNKKLLIAVLMAICLISNVFALGAINIAETTVVLSAAPGASASTTMQIQNNGGETFASVALSVTSLTGPATIAASQVVLSPSPLALVAGSSENPTVQVTVPSGQKAGTYTGTITAQYNSTVKDTATLSLTVSQVEGLSISAPSVQIAQGSAGQLTMTVTNTGNHDATGVSWQVTTTPVSGSGTLTPLQMSGSLNVPYAGSQSTNLLFNVPAAQAAGTYTGVVTFTWGSTTAEVPVTITVRAPTYSIDLPSVTFPDGEIDDEVSRTITVTNNGDYPLTAVMITTTADDTTITGTVPTTLSVGQSISITVTTTINDDVGAGDNVIGKLRFASNELTQESNLIVHMDSKLTIDRVRVSFDDSSWDTVNDGENYDDDAVRPGAKFEMTVKLENLFDDSTDIDIDDIEINVVMEELGEDGDDIEGDVDEFKIKAGDKSEDVTIDFDGEEMIDWDSETGQHIVTITAVGIDDNGGEHTANYTFTLDVNRESGGFFVFDRFDATPATITCGQAVRVYVEGNSIGEKGEDDTVLKITSSTLDINERVDFEIGAYDDDDCDALDPDEDGTDCNRFSFTKSFVIPKDIASGSYPLKGELYNDNGDEKTDEQTVMIQVTCGSSTTTSGSTGSTTTTSNTGSTTTTTSGSTSSTTNTGSTTTPTKTASQTGSVAVYYGGAGSGNTNPNVVSATPTKIRDLSDDNSDIMLLGLMSIAGVLLLIGIIGLIIYAAKRK